MSTQQSLTRPYRERLSHRFVLGGVMNAKPWRIYDAWTQSFDSWFAAPGSVSMRPIVGEPWYFEVVHDDGGRTPHYGRFLNLVLDQMVETTWVTGEGGTDGAETVVRIDLSPSEAGTALSLAQGGFYDSVAAARHEESWIPILAHLDEILALEDALAQGSTTTDVDP